MSSDRLWYDVLVVGGSPSGLALAHKLVDLCIASGQPLNMAVLEKAPEFGRHCMSGAVSNPHVVQRLFPNWQADGFPIEAVCTESHFTLMGQEKTWDVPSIALPKGVKKEGYHVLSLSHVVAWMATQLEAKVSKYDHINVDLLTGFSAHQVVWESNEADEQQVVGVQVVEHATGNPDEENLYARVVCFGDKGFISRDFVDALNLRPNPQCWSVGVKEVWELPAGKNLEGKVWHTLGWPILDGTFGGGFVYGMKDNRLTVGLVISLDSENPNINPQQTLQAYKQHPWLQELLAGGKLLKYGAATLPEGGYYSLPTQFACNGGLLLGDALGVLNISSLAGIDKALECGLQAAEILHAGLQAATDDVPDFSNKRLGEYQTNLMKTHVGQELYEGRYFRHAWKDNPRLLKSYLPSVLSGVDAGNPIAGFISVGLKNNPFQALEDALKLKGLMEGTADIGPVVYKKDHEYIDPNFKAPPLPPQPKADKSLLYSRPDAVWFAGPTYHEENRHIDEFSADTCKACIATYDAVNKDTPCVSDCTAEVHRTDVVNDLRIHGMSLENCVQCRTCEFVCPQENLRVRPTEQGSGPDFMGL